MVSVTDLNEFKSSALEEWWQFTLAQFFFSGALWLGVERYFTVENWRDDNLLLFCIGLVILSSIVGYFGLRQLLRRKSRIERILAKAQTAASDSERQRWRTTDHQMSDPQGAHQYQKGE